MTTTPTRSLLEITPTAELRYNLHPGQARAWRSKKRVVAVVAGAQSGKTSFGPMWLHREMMTRGPGDYLVATPTFTLLEKAALPNFLNLFKTLLQLGDYNQQTKTFLVSNDGAKRFFGDAYDPLVPTRVLFGYAENPDSLEAMTLKAAWLDEAGQKSFKRGSWESIRHRRTARWQGRILITTTPYEVGGWLKSDVVEAWQRGDTEIEVIRFDSTTNPNFPQKEFDEARRKLPRWKFDLFYRGIFTRPAGLIYDSFDPLAHKVPRFAIPKEWPRFLGLDFGGVHTSAVLIAQESSSGRLYVYREYLAGGLTSKEHATALLKNEPMTPTSVGGSHSEGQWRAEFRAGGLPVREPVVKEVEVGIERVYGAFKENQLYVFDDLHGLIDELQSYSRKLDETGEATEEIEDKSTYHRLDALRYIVSFLRRHNQQIRTAANPWG